MNNTYIIPLINGWFRAIHAPNEEVARAAAEQYSIRSFSPCDVPYECYPYEISLPSYIFTSIEKDAIIKSALKKLNMSEDEIEMEMQDIYSYMYWNGYNEQIQELANKALPEKWSFEGKDDNFILKNYLKYTFKKLQEEGKIIETDKYCIFDTGLFSQYYEPLYAYGEKNTNNVQKWYFKGFKDRYELGSYDIAEMPQRADYFTDPSDLVFNWHLPVNKNYKHILDDLDTAQRLPDEIKCCKRPLDMLKGVIDTAIQRVTANYKLAVPHYYQNKIQLLVPLYFGDDNIPDVALVLDKKTRCYQATTCLSMEMAYMDARLIARPESNWLIAENIISK